MQISSGDVLASTLILDPVLKQISGMIQKPLKGTKHAQDFFRTIAVEDCKFKS